jgi:hypothetical protein
MNSRNKGIQFLMVVILSSMLGSIYKDTFEQLSTVLFKNDEQKQFLLEEIICCIAQLSLSISMVFIFIIILLHMYYRDMIKSGQE